MTVLSDVDDNRLFPSEEEIADHCAENDSKAKPRVVGHEDQH